MSDMKKILEKMDQFAGQAVGQKPGDQVRGTEKAKPRKDGKHPFAGRLVGANESIIKELDKTAKETATERKLAEEFKTFEEEIEKNPFEKGSMGHALWRDLSKTKKASPAQQQRNRERFAKRDAEKAQQQGVAETAHQYHVVSKLDGNVLASYKTKEDAHKNAHGNPVVSGSLETIGDRQYVREQDVAEGTVDHRALGKHHEEMTDQELRKVGSKLPDSWDAAVFRRKLASHPKYAQALKHYDKSEYHFGKAARQGVAEGLPRRTMGLDASLDQHFNDKKHLLNPGVAHRGQLVTIIKAPRMLDLLPGETFEVSSSDADGVTLKHGLGTKYDNVKFPHGTYKIVKSQGVVEAEGKVDTVKMDVPLMIRMLEYAREDAQTDMDLHDVAERMIKLGQGDRTLTMDDYDKICIGQEQGVAEEQEAKYGDKYQAAVKRVGQKAREQEKRKPVDIQALAAKLAAMDKQVKQLKEVNTVAPTAPTTAGGAPATQQNQADQDVVNTQKNLSKLKAVNPQLNPGLANQALQNISDNPQAPVAGAQMAQTKNLADLVGDALADPQKGPQVATMLSQVQQAQKLKK